MIQRVKRQITVIQETRKQVDIDLELPIFTVFDDNYHNGYGYQVFRKIQEHTTSVITFTTRAYEYGVEIEVIPTSDSDLEAAAQAVQKKRNLTENDWDDAVKKAYEIFGKAQKI